MSRVLVRAGLPALVALAACDLSAPVWSADFVFPVDFPDVELADYAIFGQIPDGDLPFFTAPEQQDISGLLEEFLSDDLTGLTAEVITETNVAVTATMTISIAADPADLFAPGRSITTTLTTTQGVDTTMVVADADILRDAIALYYRIQGTLRGGPGGTPVGAGDRIAVRVNLLTTYRVEP
jgi:hypothetical protein